MLDLLDRRIIFVGGKGGVGKTTTAAALAVSTSEHGRKCLIVSTDPAHSLGDIFGQSIGDRQTQVTHNLWALEINPDTEAARHTATIKETMKHLVHPRMYGEIDRQLDLVAYAPGVSEAALLERVAELMIEAGTGFNQVIFDTAPTGHTLRLLSLPEMMTAWTEGLLRNQKRSRRFSAMLKHLGGGQIKGDELSLLDNVEDYPENGQDAKIYKILMARRRKFTQARELFLDTDATAFLLVLNQDKLSILESKKAIGLLERYRVPITAIVVNRTLPRDVDGEFMKQRRLLEEKYRDEIDYEFSTLPRVFVPLFPHDVHGTKVLLQIGKLLVI